jgi:hypothetical protein
LPEEAMSNSLFKVHSYHVIRASLRRLRQLDERTNAENNSDCCELVADIAHDLHKFMMIDEEVLRSAFLRERVMSR